MENNENFDKYIKEILSISEEAVKLASSDKETENKIKKRAVAIAIGTVAGVLTASYFNKRELTKRVRKLEEEVEEIKKKGGNKND